MAAILSDIKVSKNGTVTFNLSFSGGYIDRYEYHLNPGGDGSFNGKEITGVFFNPKEAPGKTYLSITIYYHYKSGEDTVYTNITTNQESFYAPPPKFKFNNAVKGMTWKVEDGINSKIDNITDFTNYATQYKMFLMQSETVETCESMFDENNRMAAYKLNNIVNYLTNGKEQGGYNKGDKVAESIFRRLEKLVNPPE